MQHSNKSIRGHFQHPSTPSHTHTWCVCEGVCQHSMFRRSGFIMVPLLSRKGFCLTKTFRGSRKAKAKEQQQEQKEPLMIFNFSISSFSYGHSPQFSVNYTTNGKQKDHQHCCDSNFITQKTTAKCSLLSSHPRCTEASFNVIISRNRVPELRALRRTLFPCVFSPPPPPPPGFQHHGRADSSSRTAPRGSKRQSRACRRSRTGRK